MKPEKDDVWFHHSESRFHNLKDKSQQLLADSKMRSIGWAEYTEFLLQASRGEIFSGTLNVDCRSDRVHYERTRNTTFLDFIYLEGQVNDVDLDIICNQAQSLLPFVLYTSMVILTFRSSPKTP